MQKQLKFPKNVCNIPVEHEFSFPFILERIEDQAMIKKIFEAKQKTRLGRMTAVSGGLTMIAGAVALLGWISGLRILASLRSDYIPMAPDSAVLFILFGSILLSGTYQPNRQIYRSFTIAIVCLISTYGALKFVEYFVKADLTFEGLLFPITETLGFFPLRRMSPFSGLLFLIVGIAVLLKIVSRKSHKMKDAAGGLGIVVVITGFIATTGYLFGTPLLYGGTVVPLAATSAAAFLFLGCGLVAMTGADSPFVRPFAGPTANARLLRRILPIIVMVILVDNLLGFKFIRISRIPQALFSALLTLIAIVLIILVVLRTTKTIFQGANQAEIERRRAEETLRESEEKFRTLFVNNSSAIAIIEPDTTISMVNDAYCQMSGYTEQEVIGMSWTKQIPPDDLERLQEYNRRRLINPQDAPEKYEFSFFGKSGEIKHALMSVSLIPSMRKIIASFTDITERKRTEAALQQRLIELQEARDNIKTLEGILPLCSYCHRIRTDQESWKKLEEYISEHSNALFSHGICPECLQKHFPEIERGKSGKT
jgi:PAS domain S-box-containing protein